MKMRVGNKYKYLHTDREVVLEEEVKWRELVVNPENTKIKAKPIEINRLRDSTNSSMKEETSSITTDDVNQQMVSAVEETISLLTTLAAP